MAGFISDMEACIPALRRYAASLLRDRQDADDLVHDTVVRALDRIHTRSTEADIRPWLFTILHNLFVSQTRRPRFSRARATLDEAKEAEISVRADQEDPLHWRDLMRALDSLPDEQRTVILLVSVEDLSYSEAARVLGVPVGTVMSRLSRARARLRQATRSTTELGTAEQGTAEQRPSLRRVK